MNSLSTRNETERPLERPLIVAHDPDAENAIVDPAEHNIVFTSLVTGDNDLVGLVAYSIYKQNKYDWLLAFSRQQGRPPNEAEAQSYLLGESTPRRLATYRHLAEAMIEGRGIDPLKRAGGSAPGRAAALTTTGRHQPLGLSYPGLIGFAVVIVIVALVLWFSHGLRL